MSAYGIETFGHDYLQERGIKAYKSLDELPQGIRFDGIISLDVLEHLETPWIELEQLYDLLSPGGWMVIATPNPLVGISCAVANGGKRKNPGTHNFSRPQHLRS